MTTGQNQNIIFPPQLRTFTPRTTSTGYLSRWRSNDQANYKNNICHVLFRYLFFNDFPWSDWLFNSNILANIRTNSYSSWHDSLCYQEHNDLGKIAGCIWFEMLPVPKWQQLCVQNTMKSYYDTMKNRTTHGWLIHSQPIRYASMPNILYPIYCY